MNCKLLIIDDELLIRMSLESGLEDLGYQVRTAENIAAGLAIAESFSPDVLLLDNRLQNDSGLSHVADFKNLDEDLIIILMTAYGSIQQAVEAMKKGVDHFVQKPFDLEEIHLYISRSMQQRTNTRRLELMGRRTRKFLGVSPAVRKIRETIDILANADNVDLLVCGETGTGKEVVVREVHQKSARAKEPFVKINCSAIPENLLESELFGYEKGAFTGAAGSKKGLMELKRIGGLRDIEVNVRIAAATNRDLEEEVRKGNFREDLYYRLNVMQILIPPLRERPEDIPALCSYYLEHYNLRFGKKLTGISPEFIDWLMRRHWKGNVRELRNVLERSVLLSTGDILDGRENDLFPQNTPSPAPSGYSWPLRDLSKGPVDLRKEVDAFERAYIDRALSLCDGSLSKAAQLLGCTRFTLRRRLEADGAVSEDPSDAVTGSAKQ